MSYYNQKTNKLSKSFKTITLTSGEAVLVYPITRNLFDVFYGEGWHNCARVKLTRKGLEMLRNVGNVQLFSSNMILELETRIAE